MSERSLNRADYENDCTVRQCGAGPRSVISASTAAGKRYTAGERRSRLTSRKLEISRQISIDDTELCVITVTKPSQPHSIRRDSRKSHSREFKRRVTRKRSVMDTRALWVLPVDNSWQPKSLAIGTEKVREKVFQSSSRGSKSKRTITTWTESWICSLFCVIDSAENAKNKSKLSANARLVPTLGAQEVVLW